MYEGLVHRKRVSRSIFGSILEYEYLYLNGSWILTAFT